MVGISELFKISMNKHEISRRLVYNKAIFAKVKIWLNLVGGQKVLAAGKYLVLKCLEHDNTICSFIWSKKGE